MQIVSLAQTLFDPRGRCNRKGMIIAAVALFAVEFIAGLGLWASGAALTSPAAIALKLVIFYQAFVAGALRLHDAGYSAWYMLWATLVVMVWSLVLAVIAVSIFTIDQVQIGGPGFTMIFIGILLPMLGTLLWLHFAPGEPRANRYGPVPTGLGFSHPEVNSSVVPYGAVGTA